jgi:hypothetical protein
MSRASKMKINLNRSIKTSLLMEMELPQHDCYKPLLIMILRKIKTQTQATKVLLKIRTNKAVNSVRKFVWQISTELLRLYDFYRDELR